MTVDNKSREISRTVFWEEYNREEYDCPGCGRSESDLETSFEVHHKNGNTLDNRIENLVALCRACHKIREGRKPDLDEIKELRKQIIETKDNKELNQIRNSESDTGQFNVEEEDEEQSNRTDESTPSIDLRIREPSDWMSLPGDERMLEFMESYDIILSPIVVAKNLDYNEQYVRERFCRLLEYGLITKPERGYYNISELGRQYLKGELNEDLTKRDEQQSN